MRSWVQVLETASRRNAGKCYVHKSQSDRTLPQTLRKQELRAPGCPYSNPWISNTAYIKHLFNFLYSERMEEALLLEEFLYNHSAHHSVDLLRRQAVNSTVYVDWLLQCAEDLKPIYVSFLSEFMNHRTGKWSHLLDH
jgi:hypothetical protein